MPYLFLAVAIASEVIATSALKASQGFTRVGPSVVTVIGYASAFYCLSRTMGHIPVGVTYAVWSGAGLVLITLVALLLYDQRLDLPALAGMTLIVLGIAVMAVFSKSFVR